VNDTYATGINAHGHLIGYYFFGPGAAGVRGFLYDPAQGVLTTLGHPEAALGTYAFGINDLAQVVGYYDDDLGRSHGFLYDQGVFTTFDYPGARSTALYSINNHGHLVGDYNDGEQEFIYRDGVFSTVEIPGVYLTVPRGISDQGRVAGFYHATNGDGPRGFLYDQGVFTTFNGPSASSTVGFGVNDRAQVSGWYSDSQSAYAFVYGQGKHGHNLLYLRAEVSRPCRGREVSDTSHARSSRVFSFRKE
jgi:probable HAF family extracellular repeat protein